MWILYGDRLVFVFSISVATTLAALARVVMSIVDVGMIAIGICGVFEVLSRPL